MLISHMRISHVPLLLTIDNKNKCRKRFDFITDIFPPPPYLTDHNEMPQVQNKKKGNLSICSPTYILLLSSSRARERYRRKWKTIWNGKTFVFVYL